MKLLRVLCPKTLFVVKMGRKYFSVKRVDRKPYFQFRLNTSSVHLNASLHDECFNCIILQ